nr:D-ala-D-ala dipeptidase [uncultured bacterium]
MLTILSQNVNQSFILFFRLVSYNVILLKSKLLMRDVDFLLISDPKIWAVSVQECHEPLIDLRHLNFLISPNRAAFYAGFTKVRAGVADKLVAAQQSLPKGMRFLFSEGHRPISLQKTMFADYYAQLQKAHPEWEADYLQRETTKYIAPPEDVPPHSTGGAFDITLVDRAGAELDMGSILDETPDKNENRNFTYAANISETHKKKSTIFN